MFQFRYTNAAYAFLSTICLNSALAYEPAFNGRKESIKPNIIKIANDEYKRYCADKTNFRYGDAVNCSIVTTAILMNLFENSRFKEAEKYLPLYKIVATKSSYSRPCPNVTWGIDGAYWNSYYAIEYEIYLKTDPKKAKLTGHRAFLCELFWTDGFISNKNLGNVEERELSRSEFEKFMKGASISDDAVSFMIDDIMKPLTKKQRQIEGPAHHERYPREFVKAEMKILALYTNATRFSEQNQMPDFFVNFLKEHIEWHKARVMLRRHDL